MALRSRSRARYGYYVLIAVFAIAVHQAFAIDILGASVVDWLRRNSEAFVLVILVPLYWDIVVGAESNRSSLPGGTERAIRARSKIRPLWYGLLVAALVSLEGPLIETIFSERLPQSILTVREAWVAVFVLSLYFDWSRGRHPLLAGRRWPLVMASRRLRLLFMAAVVLFMVAIYQDPVTSALGDDLSSSLQLHAETYAAVLVLPLYFDVVIPLCGGDPISGRPARPLTRSARLVLAVWGVSLLLLLVMAATDGSRWLTGDAFGTVWAKVSEVFLASLVITAYFESVRQEFTETTVKHVSLLETQGA